VAEGLFLFYHGHRQVPTALRAFTDMARAPQSITGRIHSRIHHRRFVGGFGYWPGRDYSTYENDCSYGYPYYRNTRYAYYPYSCYSY
jgi:hypothetical protein